MLRNFKTFKKKELSVPPLCKVKETAVRVSLHDPLTNEELGLSDRYVTTITVLDAQSQVRDDSSELYSIENMQSIGLTPVVCSGNYINDDLCSYQGAQVLSSKLQSQIEKADYLKSLQEFSSQSNVEPSNNE